MSNKQKAAEFRARATKYRALGRQTNDAKAAKEIFKLAAALERQARDLDRGKPQLAASLLKSHSLLLKSHRLSLHILQGIRHRDHSKLVLDLFKGFTKHRP
jgi:hypothetical protein